MTSVAEPAHLRSMIDALSRLGPTIASLAAVLVASLVYRLNADKLFLDMLNARRDAAREVLDAAQGRADEVAAIQLSDLEGAAYNLPGQAKFWRAKDAAEGLFGPEVQAALRVLDQALGQYGSALFSIKEGGEGIIDKRGALLRHAESLQALQDARTRFAELVKPYTTLGRRGLRWREQARLRLVQRKAEREVL